MEQDIKAQLLTKSPTCTVFFRYGRCDRVELKLMSSDT